MICPRCYNHHYKAESDPALADFPCPECYGIGILHCCDGLHEQPVGEKEVCRKITNMTTTISAESADT